jgi:hypothetical protein
VVAIDLQDIAPDGIRRLTRAEYDRMIEMGLFEDERVELLHGVLVTMSPIGAPHASVVDRLNAILVLATHGRALVRVQNPFAASDDSEPEPDLALVPMGDYDDEHPQRALLVIFSSIPLRPMSARSRPRCMPRPGSASTGSSISTAMPSRCVPTRSRTARIAVSRPVGAARASRWWRCRTWPCAWMTCCRGGPERQDAGARSRRPRPCRRRDPR